MAKLGLVVNPVAGMGGRVGLKGTDGEEILQRAVELGATPISPDRAMEALSVLRATCVNLEILTYPGEMGEDIAKSCGCKPRVIGNISRGRTTGTDTKRAVSDMIEEEVDLVLFVGGDGTARDVCEVAGSRVPVLGVPAGVKIYSAVFGNTPADAGMLAARFLQEDLPTREAEVMDVDEGAFRDNELKSVLKGYAMTPYEPTLRQGSKLFIESSSEEDDKRGIARCIVESIENDRIYIIGPGTTTGEILRKMGINGTLLGVDMVLNGELLAADVSEKRILEELEGVPGAIIVSPLGQQGFILGRGNQQISAKVVKKVGKDRIVVVATRTKLERTPQLKVDTGDPDLNKELRGTISVIVGYWLKLMVQVS